MQRLKITGLHFSDTQREFISKRKIKKKKSVLNLKKNLPTFFLKLIIKLIWIELKEEERKINQTHLWAHEE